MDLENYTLVELRQLAKEKGIKNTSKLKKEEIIDFESIKSKITFNSFEDKFYVISKNIDKNRLVLSSFDYRHDTAKIVVSSSNKENIDKFLESCENVISSSTHFNEESKIFEATIDVGKL